MKRGSQTFIVEGVEKVSLMKKSSDGTYLKPGQFSIEKGPNNKLITHVYYRDLTDKVKFYRELSANKHSSTNYHILISLGYDYVGNDILRTRYLRDNSSHLQK